MVARLGRARLRLPPQAGGGGSADAHFNLLSSEENVVYSAALDNGAEISTYVSTGYETDVFYDETENAARFHSIGRVPTYSSGSQIRIPFSMTPGGTILLSWENKWDANYGDHDNLGNSTNNWTGTHKYIQLEGNGHRITHSISYGSQATSSTKASRSLVEPETAWFATLATQDAGGGDTGWPDGDFEIDGSDTDKTPSGSYPGQEFFITAGRWVRFWSFWDFGNGRIHYWAADEEDTTPIRLSYPDGIPITTANGGDELDTFEYEFNISNAPDSTGSQTMHIYARHAVGVEGLTLSEAESLIGDSTAEQY